ncbi:hypothetical protein SSCG_03484 [Streptomyces clavuligerus]|nr:hypothetical protein SSCG_03484 [Streptomyces clavuligerus]
MGIHEAVVPSGPAGPERSRRAGPGVRRLGAALTGRGIARSFPS